MADKDYSTDESKEEQMNYKLFVCANFEQTSVENGDVGMIQITAIEVTVDSDQSDKPEVFVTFATEKASGNRVNLKMFIRYMKALDFIPSNKSFILF